MNNTDHVLIKCLDIYNLNILISAVNQYYEAILHDMFVIRGNTAIFKCIVPSFVADYISVVSWEDTIGNEYSLSPNDNFGINIFHRFCKKSNI